MKSEKEGYSYETKRMNVHDYTCSMKGKTKILTEYDGSFSYHEDQCSGPVTVGYTSKSHPEWPTFYRCKGHAIKPSDNPDLNRIF